MSSSKAKEKKTKKTKGAEESSPPFVCQSQEDVNDCLNKKRYNFVLSPSITELEIGEREEEDALNAVLKALESHTTLKEIHFRYMNFGKGQFERFLRYLRTNDAIESLRFLEAGTIDLKRLSLELQSKPFLKEFALEDVKLIPPDGRLVAEIIKNNESLTKLDFAELKMKNLEDVFRTMQEIQESSDRTFSLSLMSIVITQETDWETLAFLLVKAMLSITSLNIHCIPLIGDSITYLCLGLISPRCVLTDLCLRDTNIKPRMAKGLSQAIKLNTTLKTLSLGGNNEMCYSGGLEAIVNIGMKNNSTIKELDLSDCDITDAMTNSIADLILHNSTLTMLDLSMNPISDEGGMIILKALHSSSSKLDILLNSFVNDNKMSPHMKFKIQYRTLSDLCGLYLLHQLDYDLDAIKTLIPETVFNRIDDVLMSLVDSDRYPKQV